jgi:hypothetical protein
MPPTSPQSPNDRSVLEKRRLDRTGVSRVRMPNRDEIVTLAPRRFDGNIGGAESPRKKEHRP